MFTPQEKRKLAALLAKCDLTDKTAICDGLHGFLFGLAIIPEPIMPSEWLPVIFGEGMLETKCELDAQNMISALFKIYNRIIKENEHGKLTFPFDIENLSADDLERIGSWANGLIRALSVHMGVWTLDDANASEAECEEHRSNIISAFRIIAAVACPGKISDIFDRQGDPTDPNEIEFVAKLYFTLPLAVQTLQAHSNLLRQKRTSAHAWTLTNANNSPYENLHRKDPCPCGSGRKYGKCCGSN